ncbi:3-hydroxybutyrate dehydrogenase [Evansella sp. AB-P1]|uniref:3-hydroxybutyrate dehydrogenase n=1 Tax=Evansella sp. AB-P1 TaxID=3037653 RepID=UPI00241F1FF4|nr:3-hydroxybutyrate dehydrogenase [Evansella sp. AB-P1]MDG5787442.1 3-hydroxybutyrate dehydrogenase [Evansella sp. AB-P1]
MTEWTGKVIFITGAASGIGKGIALAFVKLGANVVLCDLKDGGLKEVKEELEMATSATSAISISDATKKGDILFLPFDITKEEEVKDAVDKALNKFQKIDVLINSAGLQYVSIIEEFPPEMFEKLWRVMCFGPFLTMKYVLPHMKERKYGRIIHMASINGLVGFSGKAAYNSSKHGVIGLTKVAALETAAEGITVNALCPGYVDTPLVQNQLADLARTRKVPLEEVLNEVIYPLVPEKRLLSVQEIADYVVFLGSEKARGITGQSVVIDGGYTAQ